MGIPWHDRFHFWLKVAACTGRGHGFSIAGQGTQTKVKNQTNRKTLAIKLHALPVMVAQAFNTREFEANLVSITSFMIIRTT